MWYNEIFSLNFIMIVVMTTTMNAQDMIVGACIVHKHGNLDALASLKARIK